MSWVKIIYMGISGSPVGLFQIIGAASQDQSRRQARRQQRWPDPGTSERIICGRDQSYGLLLFFFLALQSSGFIPVELMPEPKQWGLWVWKESL